MSSVYKVIINLMEHSEVTAENSIQRQQQSLLSNNTQISIASQISEEPNQYNQQPQHQQVNAHANLNEQQHANINLNLLTNYQPNLASNSVEDHLSLCLDYIIVAIFCGKLLINGTLSQFGYFWLIYFLFHLFSFGPFKFINRGFIGLVYTWFIIVFLYNSRKFQAIGTDQRIFIYVYFIQAVPFIIKLFLACGVMCCTCACATCCFCFCLFSACKQFYDDYVQQTKFKKVREQLCRRQMRQLEDVQCPICLETGGQMNTQKCHHSFHSLCLQNWLKSHKTCPLCRIKLY